VSIPPRRGWRGCNARASRRHYSADIFPRGEMVPAQRPCCRSCPPVHEARFFVPEADLPKLAIGDEVRVTCDACAAISPPKSISRDVGRIYPLSSYQPDEVENSRRLFDSGAAVAADALRVGQPSASISTPRFPLRTSDDCSIRHSDRRQGLRNRSMAGRWCRTCDAV